MEGLITDQFSPKDLEDFVAVHGGRKAQVELHKIEGVADAVVILKSDIGKLLLKDMMNRMNELLNKATEMAELTVDERAEYRVTKLLVGRLLSKIDRWNQANKTIKGEING